MAVLVDFAHFKTMFDIATDSITVVNQEHHQELPMCLSQVVPM
jgi:hypothetical protein